MRRPDVSGSLRAMIATPRVGTGRWDHTFFSTMSMVMAAVVGVGFSRTYVARLTARTASPLVHVHGAVFASWMMLFIAQARLVARGRTRLHRRVGVGGTFLAAAILVVGAVTAVVAARHGNHGIRRGP